MKKLLLLSLIFLCSIGYSQTVLFLDDFQDSDISDWTLIDADADGEDWTPVNMATTAPLYKGMRSASWITSGALTPDNWAISPAIDLGAGGTLITLSWDVVDRDPSWDLDNYSVYVSNTPDDTSMLATPVIFTEVLAGVNVMTPRSVTLPSTLTGTIYVAFRHHDVTDQFAIDMDNVKVTSAPLKNDEFFTRNFSIQPNPVSDVFNVTSKNGVAIETIQVLDINGRIVNQLNASSTESVQVNVANLNAGVYFVKVQSELGVGTSKIIKK